MPQTKAASTDTPDRPGGDGADQAPVTWIIRRRVKAGKEAAYEAWLQDLQADARDAPGYLGVTTQRPAPQGRREYISVVRFARLSDLQAYERSERRTRHDAAVRDLVEGEAHSERLTGLEFWFTPPPGAVVPTPSRPRMALVMVAVVFSLVLTIGQAVNVAASALPFDMPYALRLLVTITLEVILMTWWLMPWLTRKLARWIYPAARAST